MEDGNEDGSVNVDGNVDVDGCPPPWMSRYCCCKRAGGSAWAMGDESWETIAPNFWPSGCGAPMGSAWGTDDPSDDGESAGNRHHHHYVDDGDDT